MNLQKLALVATLVVATSVFASDRKPASPLQWGDSPQGYLLTTDERITWSIVHSDGQAQEFIENYWARHGTGLRTELMNRIAAADKFFPLGDKKGSETERGRVFIILGAPNRQRSNVTDNVASTQSGGGGMNSIEQRAFSTANWIYKPDRLPKDLGVAELTVTFQIDVNRGYDTIENPGLVEPYLKRAANYLVAAFKPPANAPPPLTPTEVKAALAATLVPPDDAVDRKS